jgi:hypothetical protein
MTHLRTALRQMAVCCISRAKYHVLQLICLFCQLCLTMTSSWSELCRTAVGTELLMVEVFREKDSKLYSKIYPTRCNVTGFILSGNCFTCSGWYHRPSSGAQTSVSTASGICYTVTAIWRYRESVGTGLSVLWVTYATHSTLKPVPILPL